MQFIPTFFFCCNLERFLNGFSSFHSDLYIVATAVRHSCWPFTEISFWNAIIMKFPQLFQKYSFNGKHIMLLLLLLNSIQFPTNSGCYQFSKETDRQTHNNAMENNFKRPALSWPHHSYQITGMQFPSCCFLLCPAAARAKTGWVTGLWFIVTSFCPTLGSDRRTGPAHIFIAMLWLWCKKCEINN